TTLALFSFTRTGPPRHLPSFPTRRSSDLAHGFVESVQGTLADCDGPESIAFYEKGAKLVFAAGQVIVHALPADAATVWLLAGDRSEEHTSELQSLTNIECRLLMEKKNSPQ